MNLRRIVSLSLMLSVITMLTTSVILYIVPQGRVAYWAEWKLWGISKSQWGSLHTNLGFFRGGHLHCADSCRSASHGVDPGFAWSYRRGPGC